MRVCNLNQRSQRSDFEALVQACEELGVEHEARTGHKAVQRVNSARQHDDDDGDRTGAPKAFSRRITESCADGTIIMIIMNLWNCRYSVTRENDQDYYLIHVSRSFLTFA